MYHSISELWKNRAASLFWLISRNSYLRLGRSASPIRASTVLMHSRVNVRSMSFVTCLLFSLYRYSTSRGARAWIYGVLMLRSGCRNIVLNVCTHFSFTYGKLISLNFQITASNNVYNVCPPSLTHRHVLRLKRMTEMINAWKLQVRSTDYFRRRMKHEHRDTQHHSHLVHFSFVVSCR